MQLALQKLKFPNPSLTVESVFTVSAIARAAPTSATGAFELQLKIGRESGIVGEVVAMIWGTIFLVECSLLAGPSETYSTFSS